MGEKYGNRRYPDIIYPAVLIILTAVLISGCALLSFDPPRDDKRVKDWHAFLETMENTTRQKAFQKAFLTNAQMLKNIKAQAPDPQRETELKVLLVNQALLNQILTARNREKTMEARVKGLQKKIGQAVESNRVMVSELAALKKKHHALKAEIKQIKMQIQRMKQIDLN